MGHNVIALMPSCNTTRAQTSLERWRVRGYLVGFWVEDNFAAPPDADLLIRAPTYPGYFSATNALIQLARKQGADIVVPIGDDMDPDPHKSAQEIATAYYCRFPDGFGVMQPTGDNLSGTNRVCGSPWLGCGWVDRAYRGLGAFWPEYGHYFGDEELQNVARRLGCLWQWANVTQYHHHWVGGRQPIQPYQQANNKRWWHHDSTLFNCRRAAGFPGANPLPGP